MTDRRISAHEMEFYINKGRFERSKAAAMLIGKLMATVKVFYRELNSVISKNTNHENTQPCVT